MTGKSYAGIGSRRTPDDVLELMRLLARKLAVEGWRLRSGHAPGADLAFERGALGHADIFLPWPHFNSGEVVDGTQWVRPTAEAIQIAIDVHPIGEHLSSAALALHARNSHQILGPTLDDPSRFVVCWTNDGATVNPTRATGGTGQAILLAAREKITVFNLQVPLHRRWAEEYIG